MAVLDNTGHAGETATPMTMLTNRNYTEPEIAAPFFPAALWASGPDPNTSLSAPVAVFIPSTFSPARILHVTIRS